MTRAITPSPATDLVERAAKVLAERYGRIPWNANSPYAQGWYEDTATAVIAAISPIIRNEQREVDVRIALSEPEFEGQPTAEVVEAMHLVGPIANARAACRATKQNIAQAILAQKEPT